MEKIPPGKYVEISYELFEVAPDGSETLVHNVVDEEPERFIFGVTKGLLLPLERALEGLEKGQAFDVSVPAGGGFPTILMMWPDLKRAFSWSTESLTPRQSGKGHISP